MSWVVEPGSYKRSEEEREGSSDDEPPTTLDHSRIMSTTTPKHAKRRRSTDSSATPASRYFEPDAPQITPGLGDRVLRYRCYLCAQLGHEASECPVEVCIGCLGLGHTLRDCPASNPPAVCRTCGRFGHTRGCASDVRTPDLEAVRCLSCGRRGHTDCSASDNRPLNRTCLNCGADDHDVWSCRWDGPNRWHRLFAASRPKLPPAKGAAGGRGGRGSAWQRGASGMSQGGKPGPPPQGFRAGRGKAGRSPVQHKMGKSKRRE